jgi:hypothetical protein
MQIGKNKNNPIEYSQPLLPESHSVWSTISKLDKPHRKNIELK